LAEPSRHELGRNDPCHCGSGKKYKQCHLSKDEEAARAKRTKEVAPATDVAPEAPKPAAAPAKPKTRQPWKGQQNTRGFGKLNVAPVRR
jgi:preprotein translocase subunit SecA